MTFKYNQKKYKEVEIFLNKIYENTINNLSKENKKYAVEFINDLELFFYCILFFNFDISKVIASLTDIDCISFQKQNIQDGTNIVTNIYGQEVIELDNQILLNPYLSPSQNLNPKERRRLYLYKGLIKHIINFKSDNIKKFSHIYDDSLEIYPDKDEINKLVESGWLLLEEIISQEIAEKFLYFTLGKKRPPYTYGGTSKENKIITPNNIFSNLDAYRMLEPLIILFGWTLNNIGLLEAHSYNVMIHNLIIKAMNGYFVDEIITEYVYKNQEFELFQLLMIMGKLINSEYGLYNSSFLDEKLSKEENDKLFNAFCRIAKSLITMNTKDYGKDIEITKIPRNDLLGAKILKLKRTNESYQKEKY